MKIFIPNRKNKKIAIVVVETLHPKGLVFVMHGLGGWKEQAHVQTFAQAFKDNGFTTVLFDATHSFGESECDYADATTTNHYQDLADVINWAQPQSWYQEQF
jgi:predicted alpha/beta-fold hydrolase